MKQPFGFFCRCGSLAEGHAEPEQIAELQRIWDKVHPENFKHGPCDRQIAQRNYALYHHLDPITSSPLSA